MGQSAGTTCEGNTVNTGPLKVLVCDSNEAMHRIIADLLRREDVELQFAASATQLAETLAIGNPDLCLLDIGFPEGSTGIDMLAVLKGRKETSLLPVVMLTFSASDSNILLAYRHGCSGYFRKQEVVGDFEDTLRTIIRYWKLSKKAKE